MLQDATRSLASYHEASLSTAMESSGKLLDDQELADAMKERDLGTLAIWRRIIEHLLA
jgi:DNA topoisomerase-3